MDSGKTYEIKDLKLAERGKMNISLAEKRMKIMNIIKKRFEKQKLFKNLIIGICLHITKETAVLIRTLSAGGAKISISSCNPLSTQDDVAAQLVKEGFSVYGYKGESTNEYYRYLEKIIDSKPDLIIDDGADLLNLICTKHKELASKILGASEETTTGIIRLKAMEKNNVLNFPVVAVNNNRTKRLLDNYYGTGQSTLDGILRATNILIAGKKFVVAGYGPCGKGVALRAKGMGASVIVTEVNAFRALQAVYDGFEVMPMEQAAKIGDIFLTVTGNKNVIRLEHMKLMKDCAILANCGHFDVEIDVATLNKNAKKRKVREHLDEYELNGKKLYLCAQGRLANLSAAEGHPSEVMATSFAGQALAIEYLVKNRGKLPNKLITLPKSIDNEIAELQLNSMGVKIDSLTNEQKDYLLNWKHGT